MYMSRPASETFDLNFRTVCEFKIARLKYLFDLQLNRLVSHLIIPYEFIPYEAIPKEEE